MYVFDKLVSFTWNVNYMNEYNCFVNYFYMEVNRE